MLEISKVYRFSAEAAAYRTSAFGAVRTHRLFVSQSPVKFIRSIAVMVPTYVPASQVRYPAHLVLAFWMAWTQFDMLPVSVSDIGWHHLTEVRCKVQPHYVVCHHATELERTQWNFVRFTKIHQRVRENLCQSGTRVRMELRYNGRSSVPLGKRYRTLPRPIPFWRMKCFSRLCCVWLE